MKRGLISFLVSVFFSTTVFCQFELPERSALDAFFKTTTMVVTEDNPMLEYNVKMKESFPAIWKITPTGFCMVSDFEEDKDKTDKSFLTIEEIVFESDKTGVRYNFLCLSNGGSFNKNKTLSDIFHFPLSYAKVEEEDYIHKLPVAIRLMQSYLLYLKNNPQTAKGDIKKAYFAASAELKDKVLYLISDEVAPALRDENVFAQHYPFPFKFVDYDELEEKISNPEKNMVVLYKVGPGMNKIKKARCFKAIIGASDGKIYYYDYHMISDNNPDALLESDLKKLSKL